MELNLFSKKFIALLFWSLLFFALTFFLAPNAMASAKLLGRVVSPVGAAASCPADLYYFGDNCGVDSCEGPPNYLIMWEQEANSNTISNNDCYFDGGAGVDRPRYTFEWTNNPDGDADGKWVTVNLSIGEEFTIGLWSLTTTNSEGNPLPGSQQSGTTLPAVVRVYDTGGYYWNHLWFYDAEPKSWNQPPEGYFDGANCDASWGWARDPDTTNSIDVHLYYDGPAGSGTYLGSALANQYRKDLCNLWGNGDADCYHGFVYPTPGFLKDGNSHNIYVYGLDSEGGTNPLLSGSPKTINCAAPSCSLSASPNPCTVVPPASICNSTISWTTNSNIEIYVRDNVENLSGSLFASSGPGSHSQDADWIQCGRVYTFGGEIGGQEKCDVQVSASCLPGPCPDCEVEEQCRDHVNKACTANDAKDADISQLGDSINDYWCTYNEHDGCQYVKSGVELVNGQINPGYWEGESCTYDSSGDSSILYGEKKVYVDDVSKYIVKARVNIDDQSWVWINGSGVSGLHRDSPGWTSWQDVTSYLNTGWNTIKFKAEDTCSGDRYFDLDWDISLKGAPPTLSVEVEAIPNSGTAPLNDVDLKATVSGTAAGTINYKFDCTNDGQWDLEIDGTNENPHTATNLCDYPQTGNYTAKVKVEKEAFSSEDVVIVTVSSPPIPSLQELIGRDLELAQNNFTEDLSNFDLGDFWECLGKLIPSSQQTFTAAILTKFGKVDKTNFVINRLREVSGEYDVPEAEQQTCYLFGGPGTDTYTGWKNKRRVGLVGYPYGMAAWLLWNDVPQDLKEKIRNQLIEQSRWIIENRNDFFKYDWNTPNLVNILTLTTNMFPEEAKAEKIDGKGIDEWTKDSLRYNVNLAPGTDYFTGDNMYPSWHYLMNFAAASRNHEAHYEMGGQPEPSKGILYPANFATLWETNESYAYETNRFKEPICCGVNCEKEYCFFSCESGKLGSPTPEGEYTQPDCNENCCYECNGATPEFSTYGYAGAISSNLLSGSTKDQALLKWKVLLEQREIDRQNNILPWHQHHGHRPWTLQNWYHYFKSFGYLIANPPFLGPAEITPAIAKTDLNQDGKTDIDDFKILLRNWGEPALAGTDLNFDGVVNAIDLEIMRRKIKEVE